MARSREKRRPRAATEPEEVAPTANGQPWGIGAPEGVITGVTVPLQIAYGRGAPWADVNRHDPYHVKYGNLFGVRPAMLKAMEVIESGGQSIPNSNGFPNFGVMQLTYSRQGEPQTKWEAVAQRLGLPFREPEGQIAAAAYVLGGHDGDRGTPEEIFLSHYYPIRGGLDVPGPDGHTQRQYLSDMHELMRLIDAAEGVAPVPGTVDPYDVIFGGKPARVEYGWLDNAGLPYYKYGVGHGTTSATQHTGDDVLVPYGTPLYAPLPGVVQCMGNAGSGSWGQGCGSYTDTGDAPPGSREFGVGNITVLLDVGIKLTLGHCRTATLQPGQRFAAGQQLGSSGGQNGAHTHVEVAELRNGSYWLIDPKPALIAAMGGVAPVVYAERLPIPQPGEFEVSVLVTATRDGVPVLQRADLASQPVNAPLNAGDEFRAVYQVVGNDGNIYWVSTLGSRVPVEGTSAPDWHGGGGSVTPQPEPDNHSAIVAELVAVVEAYGAGVTRINAAQAKLGDAIRHMQGVA